MTYFKLPVREFVFSHSSELQPPIFSRERSSTGSNDCFVVVLVVLVFYPLVIFKSKSLFVPCYGTFCAFPWHISLFVPCCGTFCAVLWHILCRPVAQKSKSLFVPCYGTFCAFPWHISLFVPCCGTFFAVLWHILRLPVAHKPKSLFVPCYSTLQVKNCKSRIASQELQVKNCKSRIAKKSLFRHFGHLFLAA
jgi:hypothetical protein